MSAVTLTMLDQTTKVADLDVSSDPAALVCGSRVFTRQPAYGSGIFYNEVSAMVIDLSPKTLGVFELRQMLLTLSWKTLRVFHVKEEAVKRWTECYKEDPLGHYGVVDMASGEYIPEAMPI